MFVRMLRGYWTVWSDGRPIVMCASLTEALKQMIECTRALRYDARVRQITGDSNDANKTTGAEGAAGD